MNFRGQLLGHHRRVVNKVIRSRAAACNVFINYRGIDTRRSVASLLYYHLTWLNLHPFLDYKNNMEPEDKLFEKINGAIWDCEIGVAIFSPRYCHSYSCLHELAPLIESRKIVTPIFCDIKPSELDIVDNGIHPLSQIRRFQWALEEAKYTVELTFNSFQGNWLDVLIGTSDIVIKRLIEIEEEEQTKRQNTPTPFPYTIHRCMGMNSD